MLNEIEWIDVLTPPVDMLHGGRKVLLEVDSLVDQPVLLVQALLLGQCLLGNGGGKNLVGILLRMNLEQRGGVDLAEHGHLGLLAGIGRVGVGFEIGELLGKSFESDRTVPRVESVLVIVPCPSSEVAYWFLIAACVSASCEARLLLG